MVVRLRRDKIGVRGLARVVIYPPAMFHHAFHWDGSRQEDSEKLVSETTLASDR